MSEIVRTFAQYLFKIAPLRARFEMKKLFVLMAIVCWTADLMAQNQTGKLSLRPMAGVNFSGFSNATADIYRMKVGFTGGAELEYGINSVLGLSFGLIYSQEGAKVDGKLDGMVIDENGDTWMTSTSMDGKLNCSYLNLPLMANFHIPAVKGLTYKVGFQVGILTSDKMSAEGMIVMLNSNYFPSSSYTIIDDRRPNQIVGYKTEMSDVCKSIDFGLPIGLSYEYKNIVLDARYYFGLTQIDKTDNPDTARNQYLSITLGYKFHL